MTRRGRPRADEDRPVVPARTSTTSSTFEDELTACRLARRGRRPNCCCKAKQHGFSDRQLANLWNATEREVRDRPQGARHRGRVQARRHLRRRVRGVHAVLLLDLRSARSGEVGEDAQVVSRARTKTRPAGRQGPHHDPRRRAEPHRPGDRVRLLLLPGRVRPARGRATR